jgi:hypothetical protein
VGRIAHDSGDGESGGAVRHPISTHPAFPFIVALWFAALLGIGSLVVPVPVIEGLVAATGLSALVPQAAPPLGFTARALVALACAAGGGLVGLLIARKVAREHRTGTSARLADAAATARRPIAAHDELGEDGFDGLATPRDRRALAGPQAEEPAKVLELATLPGGDLPLSALDKHDAQTPDLADEQNAPGPVTAVEPAPATGPTQPERDGDAGKLEPVAPEAPGAMPKASAPAEAAEWLDRGMDDLALVQLAQRLGASIARRREIRATQQAEAIAAAAAAAAAQLAAPMAADGPLPALLAEEFDAAEAAEAVRAKAAYFGSPAFLADEPVDDDVITRPVAVAAPVARPGDQKSEPTAAVPGKKTFAQPLERPMATEAPAPALPSRVDTAENERALREALLNLQRMSGVG